MTRDAGGTLTSDRNGAEEAVPGGDTRRRIQYDTLVKALEMGYFDVPRAVVTEELATQLGVSDQAITERIRRGITNVLTHILVTPAEDTTPDTET